MLEIYRPPVFALWFQIGAVAAWLGAVLLVAEILRRQLGESELVRKVVHIGMGNIMFFAWGLQLPLWLCLSASISFCIITYISYHIPILPMLNSVGRKTLGVFYYSVSITCLVAYFWTVQLPQYAVVGVVVMAWGDGVAALAGKSWGKHTYTFMANHKSFEGSFAMLIASYVVTCLVLIFAYSGQNPPLSIYLIPLPVAIAATLLEAISPGGTDNLTVPIASAAMCYGLQLITNGYSI